MSNTPGETPETSIVESDPNADSPEGLTGEMGVSSERRGFVRGTDQEVTYGTLPTHPDSEDSAGDSANASEARSEEGAPPEQSAYDGQPEVHPDNDVPSHPRNPQGNPGHSGG